MRRARSELPPLYAAVVVPLARTAGALSSSLATTAAVLFS